MQNPVRTRMKQHRLAHVMAALLCIAIPQAQADDYDIEWNGFINIVGGMLKDEPVKDFTDEKQYPSYQGYEADLTFDPHSSAGIQAKKKLDDKTAITMQLYAEGDIEHYQANVKWMYVTYTPTYHSTFRIGRIGTPVYYFSDFLNVGYAYHWVTPPEPVYPFDTTVTGIDYIYQNVWNDIEWSAEVLAGADDEYLGVIGTRIITRNGFGTAFSASTGDWLSFRAMLYRADSTFKMDVLTDENIDATIESEIEKALTNMGFNDAQIDAIAPTLFADARTKIVDEDLTLEDFDISYGNIALRAETERWLLMTEVSRIHTNTYLFNDVIARYITGGVRFGPALYHVTLASGKTVPNEGVRADVAYTLPASPTFSDYTDLMAARFKSTLAGSMARNVDTVSVGVRIDTSQNTALKFEITHIDEKELFEGDTYAVGKNTLFRAALNATF